MKGYFGSFLYEDVDTYLKISPLTYAETIHTPLLILHSENDLRCPIEQGEQLFVTLRLLRRPVEMVRFPVESHELSRSGSPIHRVQRFELVLEWFDRFLKKRRGRHDDRKRTKRGQAACRQAERRQAACRPVGRRLGPAFGAARPRGG
jgi:hypothetical protein